MVDFSQQQHEMSLEKMHSSGAEEWYCPECGRRILRRVPSTQAMIILEPGDQSAIHSGSRGGLRIGAVQVAQQDAEPDEVPDESLHLWMKALEDLNLGE